MDYNEVLQRARARMAPHCKVCPECNGLGCGNTMPGSAATADVLPEIADAVGDRVKILVDGGIRSGTDIFRALALGADAVMICRPFLISYYGGGTEGIVTYVEKLRAELTDAMYMCGARCLSDITRDMVRELR